MTEELRFDEARVCGAAPPAKAESAEEAAHLQTLNPAQREAVLHGREEAATGILPSPLLIIAGAGSGKTKTLAHRVAQLILDGADPRRILLLTFTRRAAGEMTRRAVGILEQARGEAGEKVGTGRLQWSGTFHAIANRLLRYHAQHVGLDERFTVLDRSDSADLLDLQRTELGLAKKQARFPRKSTCLSIYSHAVNAQCPVEETLESAFPWCEPWADELKALFRQYVAAKQRMGVLDYDDLLLYWSHLMAEPELARVVGERFDHVMVDEYQDTNRLQASILMAMKPSGRGLTVVGDDAQSIYAFRAASVRNILDFPTHFDPPARVVTLEQNYRSTQPILEACNAVIGQSRERYAKQLFSDRPSDEKPRLVSVEDESEQVDHVVEQVLAHREQGIDLKRQAVLMRAAHHSDPLEVELTRRSIPFVKFGGLRFLEAAHVKDVMAVLRLVENPRDAVAGFRVLQLLPGIGPGFATRALDHLTAHAHRLESLRDFTPPAAARRHWEPLCGMLETLRDASTDWQGQMGVLRRWYGPHLDRIYDAPHVRRGDLEQLEQIAGGYPTRERFLTELTLDPPDASGDEAGDPLLDEDYLILSTIHSAKGQEWDAVYVLGVADGSIPSDMATGRPEQIEEERRLLYVAMPRAREHLHLVHPQRYYKRQQPRAGDASLFTPRTRFIPDAILDHFERCGRARADAALAGPAAKRVALRVDVGAKLRSMWD